MAEADEEWQEPPVNDEEDDTAEGGVGKAVAQINSHLLHPGATQRDQFLLMRNDEVGLFWNTGKGDPELVYTRQNWTDHPPVFSPNGSFLCTFHKQGIALWCGPQFTRVARWAHPGARLVEWSPQEGYACTWGPDPIRGEEEGEDWNCAIWSSSPSASSQPLRTFLIESPSSNAGNSDGKRTLEWPVFKFSHDDKYVARMVQGEKSGIYVYELPGMGLEGKKPLRIDEVQGFSWSPSDNLLSFWVPEVANNPARVTVTKFPQRDVQLRTKNLFNVADCKMHWSPSGSHLSVQVTRYTKTKKSTFTNFEIFRIKEKDVPVDVVDMKQTETIVQFAWEPSDSTYRFAVLANEGTGAATKTIVYVYDVPPPTAPTTGAGPSAKEVAVPITTKVFRQLDRKSVAGVHWSPKGRFIVLRGTGGDIEFHDVDDGITMAQQEHFGMGGVEWDPSGRYVASVVTGWKSGLDTGYNFYTLTGQPIIRKTVMGLRYFSWRPRPPTLLSTEQMKAIRKNLKKYSEKYEKMDALRETEVDREVKERKKKLWEEWQAYRAECLARVALAKPLRLKLRGWDDDERPVEGAVEGDGGEVVEEWMEEVVEEHEEEVDDVADEDDD
ncbi:dipeptidyl peptidase IV/CD26, N-terminal domain-containing protein [Gonapodya prolifera JEL478]|uniref:Eukaryotic translation initiation factor 3 subunit B n=1 Tax=Gonapodya prolifera (strain JEL478) TaxID=1344416 RepID=A0A139AGV5_GONPJ|nr:dipeptidyl peptidase IV/CD26, N-terminal domain-containing protein [Gonapodya prolifera JEL478]|eukprot:KXS15978.1 dipeptidyl peptidase IV/CD26, N-terminal domain-containing protein [Gonapodya prolifera JEL478]